MLIMKLKRIVCFLTLGALLSGCYKESVSSSKPVENMSTASGKDAYNAYINVCSNKQKDSYTAAVRSSYSLSYSDNSTDIYSMDGVLAVENEANNPQAHITQHISSNGMNSDIEGYYYGGRLYNTYNNVNYYEDMDIASLKSTMMMPLAPYAYDSSMISSIEQSENSDGDTVYHIVLNDSSASDLFSSRYDQYGFSSYDDYKVTSNSIDDTFSQDGTFKKEEASFKCSVSYSGQSVSVSYTGSVEYADGNTTVEISDKQKEKDSAYVSYNDIDTSSISGEIDDDSAEATVAGTFRKRLINRLGYEEQSDGTLRDTFNTDSTYIIDFNSCTFEYMEYSIAYIYNWKTNTGAMDACTYDFASGNASSQCKDSTVDTIQDVKNDLQMELYYCGLSLEDLQKEAAS